MIKDQNMQSPEGHKAPLGALRHLPLFQQDVAATAVGLTIPDDMAESDWLAIGKDLGRCESSIAWATGDWWAYGATRYGERARTICADDWTGPAYQTCVNCATTARAFETTRRRLLLSFSHHAEVAALRPDEADALLDWAEETIAETGKPRSVRAIREERARRSRPQVETTTITSWPAREQPPEKPIIHVAEPRSEAKMRPVTINCTPSEAKMRPVTVNCTPPAHEIPVTSGAEVMASAITDLRETLGRMIERFEFLDYTIPDEFQLLREAHIKLGQRLDNRLH